MQSYMPIEERRGIFLLNEANVMVLPKHWIDFWKIKKGERLKVLCGSVLVVFPPSHPNEKEIEDKVRDFLIM